MKKLILLIVLLASLSSVKGATLFFGSLTVVTNTVTNTASISIPPHATFISSITMTNTGMINTNGCILSAAVSFDNTNFWKLSTWRFDTNAPSQKTFQLAPTNVPIFLRLIVDGSQSGSVTNSYSLGGYYGN